MFLKYIVGNKWHRKKSDIAQLFEGHNTKNKPPSQPYTPSDDDET
jgi:hypothetical protein